MTKVLSECEEFQITLYADDDGSDPNIQLSFPERGLDISFAPSELLHLLTHLTEIKADLESAADSEKAAGEIGN